MANQERLELLADVIHFADQYGHWSMGTWGTEYEDHENKLPEFAPLQECGFAACAAGWTLLVNGWEMIEDNKYEKDGVILHDEYQIGAEAADILDIESPWETNWRGEFVANNCHLFFWTGMSTDQIIESVKHLGKGEDMGDIYYEVTGEYPEGYEEPYDE